MKGAKGAIGPAGGTIYFWASAALTVTSYFVGSNHGAPAASSDITTEFTVLSSRNLVKLRVYSETSVTKDITFTVYKNGVATALTCTMTSGTATANDTGHTVAILQGDTLALRASHTAGAPGGGNYFYVTVEAT